MSRFSSPALKPSFGELQHSPLLGLSMPMPPSPPHSPIQPIQLSALALDEDTIAAAESHASRATPATAHAALSPLSSVLAREKRVTGGGVRFADDSPAASASSTRAFFGAPPASPGSAQPATAPTSDLSPTLAASHPPLSPTAAAAKITSLSLLARLASSKLSPQGASAFASKFAGKWKAASFGGASPAGGSPMHAPNPLQWEDKPIVAPPAESDAERERRLTAKGNDDLAFLLGMSSSASGIGGGGALFSNAHVKRKTANLAELQSVEIQRRKSSVADQAERMANIKRAMAVAEQTSINSRRHAIAEEEASASPPETPATATEAAALPPLPSAIDVDARASDGAAAPDDAESSPTGGADADLQRLLAADDTPERSGEEDTSTEESDADEPERERKRTKRKKFLTTKAEREARLAEMFAAAEKRSMAEAEKRHAAQHRRVDDDEPADDAAAKTDDGSAPSSAAASRRSSRQSRGGTEWLAEKARLRLLLSPSRGEVEEETEEEKAAMAASIAEAKRIAREEEEEDRRAEIRAKEEAEKAAAAVVAAEEAAVAAAAAAAAAAESKRRKRRSRRTQSSQISPSSIPADSAAPRAHHRTGSLQLSQRRQAAGSSSAGDAETTPIGSTTPTRTRRQTGGPPGSDSAAASSARARAIHARTVSMESAGTPGSARSSLRRVSSTKGVMRQVSAKRSSGGGLSGSATRDAASLSVTLPTVARAKKSAGGVHFGSADPDDQSAEVDADGLPKVRVQVLGGLTHRGGAEDEEQSMESGEDDESYSEDDDDDQSTPTDAAVRVALPADGAEPIPAVPAVVAGELAPLVYSDDDKSSASGSVAHSRQSSAVPNLLSPKQRPASAGRAREAVQSSMKRTGSVSAPTSPRTAAVDALQAATEPQPVPSASPESALNDSAAAETAGALAADISILDTSSTAVQIEDAPSTPPSEAQQPYEESYEPEPEPAYTPEYLTPARRAQVHLPQRAGSMSFFARTASNKVLRPGAVGYTPGRGGAPYSAQVLAAFGRQPGPTQEEKEEAALAARELAARSREKLGFGSGSSQRPKTAPKGMRKKGGLTGRESFDHDPLTLRSSLSPSGRSARRLYGATVALKKSRSAASGLTIDQGQGVTGVASARQAYSPTRATRERNEDGSLKPPWALSTARTPVDNPAALHLSIPGAFRTSLPLKQTALTSRVQRMNGFVPSSILLDEFGAPIASSRLASNAEIESTRRAVERRMGQKSARAGSSERPHSASAGRLHHIVTVPAPSRSLQQFSAAAGSTPSVPELVDTLFATPAADPPSPFKTRNLFEHTAAAAADAEPTAQTQGRESVIVEDEAFVQHSTPAPATARPLTHRGGPAVATVPPSLFSFEEQEQSVYFQSSHNRGVLGSSASTPALFYSAPALPGRNGLVRGRTPGSATKHVSSRDIALREGALKRQAAAERLKQNQEAAARTAAAQQREIAARTRGGAKGWLEVMMLEAQLVAAQKLQAAQEQELGNLLASTAAHTAEEKEQQHASSSRPSSPQRVAVAARSGQSYASPVPLAPAHFQPAMTAPPDLQLNSLPAYRPTSAAAVRSPVVVDAARGSRSGGRTFGGMDPILRANQSALHASASSPALMAQQQQQQQLWPVQRVPPSVADWAGSILAAVSDSPAHFQSTSHLDPMATWRAAQGRGSTTSQSPLQVPLSELISSIKHVNPILRMGTPGRSDYAAKLQAGQRALSTERVRRLRALAPPEHPYIMEADF